MSKKRLKSHHCNNCDYTFKAEDEHSNFCPNCGQENHNPRQPLFHYGFELLESLFHLDAKLWFTLRQLLFNPGAITKDYIGNKRARYTPPVRMFVFSLAIFIVVLEIAQDSMVKKDFHEGADITLAKQMEQSGDTTRIAFSGPLYNGDKIHFTVAQLKELKATHPSEIGNWLESQGFRSGFIYRMEARMVRHCIYSSTTMSDLQRHITHQHYWLILIMLPVTALLIYIFFYRRGLLYYDALVMSLHFYSFSMVFGIAISLTVMQLISLSLLKDTTIILPMVHLFSFFLNFIPAYKKVFELSWPSTLLRAFAVSIVHFIIHLHVFWLIAGYGII